MILIRNNIDLEENQVISKEQAEEYCKKNNILLILTSAATGEKVEDVFKNLIM